MSERPKLDKNLDGKTFREFYYLKEELVGFCRRYGLPTSDFLLMLHFRNGLKAIRAKLMPMRLLRIIGYLKKRKTVRQKLTSSLNTIHI